MTDATFRKLALDLPGATEGAHERHPDFRANGQIFATLWPDGDVAVVGLASADQQRLVEAHPEVFEPVEGDWGRHGATKILLRAADEPLVVGALAAAFRKVAGTEAASKSRAARTRPRRAATARVTTPRRPAARRRKT